MPSLGAAENLKRFYGNALDYRLFFIKAIRFFYNALDYTILPALFGD
jgi:hypothetical protein